MISENKLLINDEERKTLLPKRGKYLSECEKQRHPVSRLCINSCEFNDQSLFCGSVPKSYCQLLSVSEKCAAHCKCPKNTISFRGDFIDSKIYTKN